MTNEEMHLRNIRDLEIVKMVDNDRMTMTAVGKYWGISKQRVLQIYKREKQNAKIIKKLSKDV